MNAKRWVLPIALALLSLAPVARSQDDEGDGNLGTGAEPAQPEGWKGLPGAKDPGEPGKAPGWIEIELKITPVEKDWGFRTPREAVKVTKTNQGAWIDVTNGILPLVGLKGGAMKFLPLSGKIMADLDGDGQNETALSGEAVTARVRRPDGSEGVHHFRLRRDGDAYLFNRSCMAVGKIEGTPIAFIDEDNSGSYGDNAADAVRIGGAPVAQYMSEVINVKNALYYLKVNQAGGKAWFKPFDGPVGTIDLASQYRGKSKPLFVMLRQGEIVIDAAAKDTKMPAGTWAIMEGVVGPSMFQCARILSGRMSPIVVKESETTRLPWGMPGAIDFNVTKNGNLLRISGPIRIYGAGGEEYVEFRPRKFTPNIQVAEDSPEKKLLMEKNMGAGC